jgi:hypothetical protein
MAKLIRCETDYRFYAVELTDEQFKLYKENEDVFWEDDEMQDELRDEMEFTRDKDGGTDFWVEE